MKLLTKEQQKKLLANGQKTARSVEGAGADEHKPVVKVFNPCGAATWLITEMDPDNEDILYGLCDLGMGFPELGYVSLSELKSVKTEPFGLSLERDLYFRPEHTIAEYARLARIRGRIDA